MRIQDYLNVLTKRWWVILLVTVSAAVAAYGISKLRNPIYRSQTIYSVNFNRLDTGGNFFADELLNGYVMAVRQPDRMEQISQQLQLDQTGSSLMQYVRLQPQPDQRLIVIEADYFDPGTAQAMASAVGDQLNAHVVEVNRNLEGEDRVSLMRVQSASNVWQAKPNTQINVLAATLLGFVLGVLLSFVLEYLDDTLKTAADVERFAGLATIGAIPATGSLEGRRRTTLRPTLASGLIGGGERSRGSRADKEAS